MKIKTALIPIAAFAVTVSAASAFDSSVLEGAGLNDDQIAAFEEARDLRESGDREGARDVLVEAGIDVEIMQSIREAMHEARSEHRNSIREAVENEDYDAFLKAIEDSPLADIIDTKAEFESFVEAHNLMEEGDREAAKEIMDDLGIEHPEGNHGKGPRNVENASFFDDLTDEQKADLQAAMEDRDHDKVKEILKAAGIEMPDRGEDGRGFGSKNANH